MKVRASVEMLQDIHSNYAMIRGLSRNPITDEEIDQWRALNNMMDNKYVFGARIKTDEFTDQELAMYSRLYERYPAGMVIRTPDPSDEEIKEWQEWYVKINAMNLHEIRKKVHFLHEEEYVPYPDEGDMYADLFKHQPKAKVEPDSPKAEQKKGFSDILKDFFDFKL